MGDPVADFNQGSARSMVSFKLGAICVLSKAKVPMVTTLRAGWALLLVGG